MRDPPAGTSTAKIFDSNFHRSTQRAISCRIPDTSIMFISRCNFTYNYRTIIADAFLTIENRCFSDNSISGYYDQGGAISASYMNITNSTFSHNTAGDDGGVMYLGQSGNLAIITASNFTSNSAVDRGGVIALIASTVYIFQSNIM